MNNIKIRWIGQGGYIISDGKTELCIDPYLSNVVDRIAKRGRMVEAPFPPEELASDAVICTHDHIDHVDIDAIPLMKKDNMLFLAPQDAEKTLRSCGVTNYLPFDEGMTRSVGDFELHAVFAEHSATAIGVIIKHSGITIYISGDTLYNERLEALADKNIDVMIICINGKLGNMNVEEAIRLTRIISPKVAIPTHYGMFESNTEDPKKFTDPLDCGFELQYNKEYSIEEILKNV